MMKETLLLFAKYLGKFSYKNSKSIACLLDDIEFPTKYICYHQKTFHIGCLLCVEFCQVLLTHVKRFIMLPRSRSRTRLIYMLLPHRKYAKTCFSSTSKCSAPTLGEDKNMFARFYQNKCSKFLIIFLSKVVVKRDMRYAKI